MAEVRIPAEQRSEFGKGASRRLRAQGMVPGVIYGHGTEPVHVAVPSHALMLALKTPNVLINLLIKGGKDTLVLPKAVQRGILKGFLEHVDFLVVQRGETVTVDVPIHVEGELAPGGNLLEHLMDTLSLEAEATHIPETVTVNVQDMSAGRTVHAKEIVLPDGATLAVEPEEAVLQVVAAQAEEAPAEAEEAEAGAGA